MARRAAQDLFSSSPLLCYPVCFIFFSSLLLSLLSSSLLSSLFSLLFSSLLFCSHLSLLCRHSSSRLPQEGGLLLTGVSGGGPGRYRGSVGGLGLLSGPLLTVLGHCGSLCGPLLARKWLRLWKESDLGRGSGRKIVQIRAGARYGAGAGARVRTSPPEP